MAIQDHSLADKKKAYMRAWQRAYRLRNREQEARRKALWYLENRERVIARVLEYRRKKKKAA